MADVGGPTSRLPGAHLSFPPGTMCDEHDDRPAVKRIQGETDSFGYEACDMCQECYDKYEKEKEEGDGGSGITHCDHCSHVGKTTATRDPDEGSCGPVYYLCDSCLKKLRDYHARNYD